MSTRDAIRNKRCKTPLAEHIVIIESYASESDKPAVRADWPSYNGDVTGDHYSPLNQITPANVQHLKELWRFNAGADGGVQTNPLVVGRVLYGYTATLQVVALDGTTGKQLWHFDSGIVGRQPSRGLSYWSDGSNPDCSPTS
jgi:quinoprotein glucose dehydrogenase